MRKPFIYVSNFLKARWCNKKRSTAGGHYIDANTLMNMITWLVKNTFVIVGNKIYQQVIGIPMGTDCAPYLANLFLYAYELEFLSDTLKLKDFSTLYKFKKCFAINNDGVLNDFEYRIRINVKLRG